MLGLSCCNANGIEVVLRLRVVEHALRHTALVEVVLSVLTDRSGVREGPGTQRRVLLEGLSIPRLGAQDLSCLAWAHVDVGVSALGGQELLAEAGEDVALVS